MIESKEVRFHCTDSDDSMVTFVFDAFEMDHQEMFMKWVQFMNAIGYVLDQREMEDMWNGVPSEEEKIPTEAVIRHVIAEFEFQLMQQGIDHSNDTKWSNAFKNTIREMNNRLASEYGMFV